MSAKLLEESVYYNLLLQCYNQFNHLYYHKRNRVSIISWRRLSNRNRNLRLPLTRFLANAPLRERSNKTFSLGIYGLR